MLADSPRFDGETSDSLPMTPQTPPLVRRGLGWQWVIEGGLVTLRADYLKTRGEDMHGEILIESELPGVRRSLVQESFNFSSGRTRDQLAKALTARTPKAGIPWSDVIDLFCMGVLRKERQGEPVMRVGNLVGTPPARDLIERLLPAGKPTIWYGPGGSGKGYMTIAACVCHETGVPLAGWNVQGGGHALLLDYEDSAETANERIVAVAGGLGVAAPNIAYRKCRRPLVRDLHEVMRHADDVGATLIVIDSFGLAAGAAGERSYEDLALATFDAIRCLEPATVLIVDHVSGGAVTAGAVAGKAFGSIYKMNEARAAWEIRADQEPGSRETRLAFHHTKYNHSRQYPPMGFRLEFGDCDDGDPAPWVRIHREDLRDSPVLSRTLTLADRLSGALRDGAKATRELAELLDVGEPLVRATLNRPTKTPRFVRLQDGRWGLAMAHEGPSDA